MVVTRVPVLQVRPQVEGGRFPVKAVVDEDVVVRARVFGEGSAVVGAAVVLTGPDGAVRSREPMRALGDDAWSATVRATEPGDWTFAIESWHDPIATWKRDAAIKVAARVEVETMLAEGAALLERVGVIDPSVTDTAIPPTDRLVHAIARLEDRELRDDLDATDPHPLQVDRERALAGAWYQLFPRSEGAVENTDGSVTPGTLRTAAERLDAVAAMGFDVVLLPPIHPIGFRGRKGRNSSITALPSDPGSPWAVGSRAGGHDTVHPDLGTLDDLDAFVARAGELGLEVALELALQCSPDHPWVAEHPEWFVTRADGSIAHAEDPPHRFLDVYALSFDEDPAGLYLEVRRVIEHWVEHGIRLFRVDDAHTKPLAFWQQLLADLRHTHPDVLFTAETSPAPAALHGLGVVGFHQVRTDFTRLEQPQDLAAHLVDVSSRTPDVLRPAFWVNTPELLPTFLQTGDPATFRMRAGLAATASPTWGMYAGFELMERDAIAGTERYFGSEVHEVKVRDWTSDVTIAPYVTRLNAIRGAHPALRRLRPTRLVPTDHHRVVAFTKQHDDDLVLVVVDARPWYDDTVEVRLDAASVGLSDDVTWHDEVEQVDVPLGAVPIGPEQPVRVLVPRPTQPTTRSESTA